MNESLGSVEARDNIGNSSQPGGLGPSWAAAGPSSPPLPPPLQCQASTPYYFMGIPGEVQSHGWGVGSGEAWDSHYLLTSMEVSQCLNSPFTLTLDVPAG